LHKYYQQVDIILPNEREICKKEFCHFCMNKKVFCEKGDFIMTQEFLWVFLLSVLSSQNDTNLATNTNILLLLLLGLANTNDFDDNRRGRSLSCNRCFGLT
jgi:hypothetical protein